MTVKSTDFESVVYPRGRFEEKNRAFEEIGWFSPREKPPLQLVCKGAALSLQGSCKVHWGLVSKIRGGIF